MIATGTVLELFAGAGGAALGLKRAGWEHVGCVERLPAAAATLRSAGLPAIEQDVRELDWAPFRGQVDLLWASPPCQAGSIAGKRRGPADERNGWPWTMDAIDAVDPHWFLAENVLGWTHHRRGCPRNGAAIESCRGCYWERRVVLEVGKRFSHAGWWLLNAADFGVPQRRRRAILWAGPHRPAAPRPTHGEPSSDEVRSGLLKPWVTFGDAIGDTLLDPTSCDSRHCYPCDGSHGLACAEPWRLAMPAPTVTTTEEKGTRAHAPHWSFNGGPDRASDAAFLVAGVRRIDIEEGLKLQGFPEDWPLQGTKHDRYVQIGNAVPPPLANALGASLARAHRHVL